MEYNSLMKINFKENRNIILFYILGAATNCWFLASNWIYFWTKYMTYGQLGWADGLAFGVALLLDVPTGAIADIFGKKKTIIVALFTAFVGSMMIATASSFNIIFIGWMITNLGFALYSGAAEALAYDTLVDLKQEDRFDQVISKASSIDLYTDAITVFIGGLIYGLNFRLPHILWSLAYFVGFIVSFYLIEPKVDTIKFSFKNYFNQIGLGIKELLQPKLRRFFVYFFILLGIYFMYSWGFIRPAIADSFGFKAREQGIIIPILTLSSAFLMRYIPFFKRKVSEFAGLIIMAIVMALSFIIASFPIGFWGIIAMIFIAFSGKLAYPWISIIVNKEIQSKYRATTLSTISLITKIPYVLVAVVAGKAVEQGQLKTVNLYIGIIIFVGIIVGLLVNRFTKINPKVETVV